MMVHYLYSILMFTEVNPDKGTETILIYFEFNILILEFTEVNPDKGTETVKSIM